MLTANRNYSMQILLKYLLILTADRKCCSSSVLAWVEWSKAVSSSSSVFP